LWITCVLTTALIVGPFLLICCSLFLLLVESRVGVAIDVITELRVDLLAGREVGAFRPRAHIAQIFSNESRQLKCVLLQTRDIALQHAHDQIAVVPAEITSNLSKSADTSRATA
jgi:hypothetical protein